MKHWYKSKTIWLAVSQAMIGILAVVSTEYPELQLAGTVAILKSVIDILLRIETKETIK